MTQLRETQDQYNAAATSIRGASVLKREKAGRTAHSVHSIENKDLYKTDGAKQKFICDSFKLDKNKILNTNNTLKEALIQLLVDNFEFLATHPSQYSETED